jgi:transcriptional regulator with XRE-family HTH domain
MLKSPIHHNIKYLIEEKTSGQKEFAQIFELSQAVVSNYANGKATPKLELILKMADHFNISMDQFLRSELNRQSKISEPYASYNVAGNKNEVKILEETIKNLEKRIVSKDQYINLLEEIRIKNEEIINMLKSQLTSQTGNRTA